MSKADELNNFIGGLPDDVKVHMSRGPIQKLSTFSQGVEFKPKGLWYDCDKEWMSWISSEMPDWVTGYNYVYTIHLNKSNILELKSEDDILNFTQEYGTASTNHIDWKKVSSKYAGIEICPYQWGLRMYEKTRWYYTWDVASGCIWNPSGVNINFIGLWSNEESRIIPKNELIGGNVEARRMSWYKRSAL